MLIREIGSRLDMQCKIVFHASGRLFRVSGIMGMEMPVFITKGDRYSMRAYINELPKDDAFDAASYINARKEGDRYLVDGMENFLCKEILEALDRLNGVTSTTSFIYTIENGHLILSFRFHSRFLHEVSDAIRPLFGDPSCVEDVEIMPSRGLESLVSNRNSRTRLAAIEYDVPASLYNDEVVIRELSLGGVIELTNVSLRSGSFRMILYTASGNKLDGMREIETGIYETDLKNDFLDALVNLENYIGVQRFNVFGRISGDRLRILVFVRMREMVRYIKTIFSLSQSSGVDIHLLLAQGITEDLWSYL